jgi:hypothetical protein
MSPSELSNSPWVSQAKEHWKKFRPKMYAELEKQGLLHERAVKAAEQTQSDLLSAINDHGLDHQSAWEAVRERLPVPAERGGRAELGREPQMSVNENGRDAEGRYDR